MELSFRKTFFVIGTVIALVVILVFGKTILIPLSLALIIAFILFPVVKKLEKWGLGSILAAVCAILMVYIVIGGFITLFSTQIAQLSSDVSQFGEKLSGLFTDVIVFINKNFNFIDDLKRDELLEEGKDWLQKSGGSLAGKTFSGITTFLTGLVTITIFSFLFLIYRNYLTKAFLHFADKKNRPRVFKMLKNIQKVGQQYLSGMFILILILGTANSLGLWIIGIDSPLLFGFLAASLSIIPYLGTTLGATIPVLYAFMTHDQLWVPLAVAGLFWFVQLVESNFLNPKIVGSSINVNPLVAILSLIVGASIWGVAGMVLFLPFAAMLKVFCGEFDQLKPVAMLINSHEDESKEDSNLVKKVKSWFSKSK